ncbi:hypothetical protein A11A3_13985 [Alcanivorax hongdengensis A-11-3]|uniref:Uncharacterized protein n=1 Tax=Alcanivorax hongdengensis A-11-3 TaxID=1177179 RepID=L0WCA9_9GAMM|nr:hypothetical protein A11A3_13985 [Alcanivorax hongdengensis A-11-3]
MYQPTAILFIVFRPIGQIILGLLLLTKIFQMILLSQFFL